MALLGWHPGESAIRARLGLDKGPSTRAYTWIGGEMPEQHRIFYTKNLPFFPLTTLDARGRPWASFAVSADRPGERGFAKSPSETELMLRLTAPVGDPLIENLDLLNGSDMGANVLVAGFGIELETRRRNKLAGRAVRVDKIGERARQVSLSVNQAIGNCPKYINVREMVVADVQPGVINSVADMAPTDRLPEEAVQLILKSDTVSFATSYSASEIDATKFPSHVGMNVRSGNPGFVRVLPSDARTLVIPDYSGNRIMTSLGNVEASQLAGASVIDFETGDILFVTGTAKNILGDEAQKIMPRQNVLTVLHVEAYTYVRNAMPVRQRPGSAVGRSPYSPPIKFLAEEVIDGSSMLGGQEIWLTLTRIVQHSYSLATFSFEADQPMPIRAGQAAALDFTSVLGSQEYSHMAAPGSELRLNDDRIRTWTISGVELWPAGKDKDDSAKVDAEKEKDADVQHVQTLHLTMREIPEGFVTGALFNLARRAAIKMPDVLADARRLGLRVQLSGISGSFCLPKEVESDRSLKFIWLAGGIGLTPFLAMLRALSGGIYMTHSAVDIVLVLATREPEVLLPLIYSAASDSSDPKISAKMIIALHVFAGTHAKLVEPPQPNDSVTITVVDRKQRFSELKDQGLSSFASDVSERLSYMCGPPSFEEASMRALISEGVDAAKVVRESFNY